MLDMKFLRENPELVKENIKKKFQDEKLPLVDEVIALDAANRAAITGIDHPIDNIIAGAAYANDFNFYHARSSRRRSSGRNSWPPTPRRTSPAVWRHG